MTDRTEVFNTALMALGQPAMSGPNDTSSWVRKISGQYEHCARLILSAYPWNFATKRIGLEIADSYAGELGARAYAYRKPADFLRINRVNDTGDAEDDRDLSHLYDDEDGHIKADISPCWLFYISNEYLTREGAWPDTFMRAVALEIAWLCAPTATRKEDSKLRIERDKKRAFQVAKSWDASQKPRRRNPMGNWAGSRGNLATYRNRTGSDIRGGGS